MHLILVATLILLAGLVLWSLLKPPAPPPEKRRDQTGYEPMVRCRECGVNLPRDRAIPHPDGGHTCPAHSHGQD